MLRRVIVKAHTDTTPLYRIVEDPIYRPSSTDMTYMDRFNNKEHKVMFEMTKEPESYTISD
jgi:hypothetical protein